MQTKPTPPFALPSSTGEIGRLSDILASGRHAVVYFYPKDDTPGCTAEACSFRDEYTAFQDAGADVIGISMDDAASHQAFVAKHNLPFTLLSDADGSVARAFGVKKTLGLIPGRETFIISPSGQILHRFSSQFNPKRHIREALEFLQNQGN